MRSEFGFERTICSCQECVQNCKRMSGFLIPADLKRLIPCGIFYKEWARENLMASPGAIIISHGIAQRIHTLVPKRLGNGYCTFLDHDQCAVHDNAPFGCCFFEHISKDEADHRCIKGLQAIIVPPTNPREEAEQQAYHELWFDLFNKGIRALGPEELQPDSRSL